MALSHLFLKPEVILVKNWCTSIILVIKDLLIQLVYKDFIKQLAYKYNKLMLQPSCTDPIESPYHMKKVVIKYRLLLKVEAIGYHG